MINNISVVIIVKNGENTIGNTLDSLILFKDVVIYDNGSTDNTLNIVNKYPNVNLIQGGFFGFGKTKNKASEFSKNDWVLSLDADEVLSTDFVKSLTNIILNDQNLYTINRINFYKNKQIKYCWSKDIIVRLYNKTKTKFIEKDVHEHIIQDNFTILSLDHIVQHYPYQTIEQFIDKANTYSTLFAQNNVGKKSSSPTKAFCNSIFSFIKTYIFKRGFLDGYIGLIIAISHSVTNFYKYIKLYELNQELKGKR